MRGVGGRGDVRVGCEVYQTTPRSMQRINDQDTAASANAREMAA